MVQTSGFQTSVEQASKQTYFTAGTKRSHDSILCDRTNWPSGGDFRRPTVSSDGKGKLKASEIRTLPASGNVKPVITEYSQRRLLASTQTASQNPLLSLSHPSYGLPDALVANFSSMGISSIYPWQSSCLLGHGLLSGDRNLVYTAPTGGGKSLVADVLMLKKIIENPGKKAILVLPYVALVQEKMRWLRRAVDGVQRNQEICDSGLQSNWRPFGNDNSIRVVGYYGGSKARVPWTDADIAVCTIEKANSLVNSAIEDSTIDSLGIVVMDELHMIDDEHRGYLLELMATKLLSAEQGVQIVGMSATLSNTELLAKWLNAKFYESKYRPIPIEEYLVYGNSIYPASTSAKLLKTASQLNTRPVSPSDMEKCRIIDPSDQEQFKNPLVNAVVALASEIANAGYGALVFCSSRKGCEVDALAISQVMPEPDELSKDLLERRRDVVGNLRNTAVGLDSTLRQTIVRGVAFHHAGLTTEERDIIVDAYDQGLIKVVVATCSLAADINLPARRVILHGARMGRDLVGPAMLQMRGRAGRKGKDEIGETYMCCEKRDLEEVKQLMDADLPAVQSCLTSEKKGIRRALLEVIATRLATSDEGVYDYIQRTLLYHSGDPVLLSGLIGEPLESLTNDSLISVDPLGSYEATLLGRAIVAASLTPEDGIFVHREIERALRAFVMDGEMHIFYMFTPMQSTHLVDINWRVFCDEMDNLDESSLRVAGYVGVKGVVVNKLAKGGSLKENTLEEIEIARTYRRFYAALQLRDLCNEMPIHAVAHKYDMPRGLVQNLVQTCEGFAAGMIKFCERMGWSMLAVVLEHMSDRLKAGAKADLLELATVTFIKSRTARIFWENGFKTIRTVAHAEPEELVPVLLLAQPHKRRLNQEEERLHLEKLQRKAEVIVNSASRLYEQQMRAELDE